MPSITRMVQHRRLMRRRRWHVRILVTATAIDTLLALIALPIGIAAAADRPVLSLEITPIRHTLALARAPFVVRA